MYREDSSEVREMWKTNPERTACVLSPKNQIGATKDIKASVVKNL